MSHNRTLRGLLAALGDDSPAFRARTYKPGSGVLRRLLIALADASPAFTGHGLRPRPPHQAAAFIEMRLITRILAGYFTSLTDRAEDLAVDIERVRKQCANLVTEVKKEKRDPSTRGIERVLEPVVGDAGRLTLDVEAPNELASKLTSTARGTSDRNLVRTGTELTRILTRCHESAMEAWSSLATARRLAAWLAMLRAEGNSPAPSVVRTTIEQILDHSVQAVRQQRGLVKDLKTATNRNPAQYLESIEIDASGADLSEAHIPDIEILDLVIWTPETTWPLAMEDQIKAHSVQIRENVYQVHSGGRLRPKRVDV